MSKSVLISVQPKWCELIANGGKTVEVRKSAPKMPTPFKCYIYCTLGKPKDPHELLEIHCADGKIRKANGRVIGEFVCKKITYLGNVATDPWKCLLGGIHEDNKRLVTDKACLTEKEMLQYKGQYGWHISDLAIYDEPKALNEFIRPCENDLYCEVCAMYSEFTEECKNAALRISRPPQSWCYVEEKE